MTEESSTRKRLRSYTDLMENLQDGFKFNNKDNTYVFSRACENGTNEALFLNLIKKCGAVNDGFIHVIVEPKTLNDEETNLIKTFKGIFINPLFASKPNVKMHDRLKGLLFTIGDTVLEEWEEEHGEAFRPLCFYEELWSDSIDYKCFNPITNPKNYPVYTFVLNEPVAV